MSRLETDLTGYIESWQGKPQPQVIEELASWSLETKRLPDPYLFLVDPQGKLISPQTEELIEKSIDKVSYLGEKEWKAFDLIQNWCKENDSGLSVWISPPHPLRTEFTKVIVSELSVDEEESKQLFNRSLMLELASEQALLLHDTLINISGFVPEVLTSEDIRSKPVFLKSRSVEDWVTFLSIKIEDQPILDKILAREDILEKEEAIKKSGVIYEQMFKKAGYDDDYVKSVMQKAKNMNFFGSYDSTCPTAFQLMFDVGAKLIRNCGACKASLNKFMKSGDTCNHCGGVYKGC